MTKRELRALLDCLMISDPWHDPCFEVLEELANAYSKHYGYDGWIAAYHELKDI